MKKFDPSAELLKMLRQHYYTSSENGLSIREIAERLNVSGMTVLKKIRPYILNGIVGVGMRLDYNIAGRKFWVPVYFLRKTKNKEER